MGPIVVLGAGLVGAMSARAVVAGGGSVVTADLSPCLPYLIRFGPGTLSPVVALDIRDTSAVRRLVRQHEAEVVVLVAGTSAAGCAQDPARAWDVHVCGTRSVARAASDSGVRRLVFLSTAAVYGRRDGGRLDEGRSVLPRTTYGRTKAAAERELLAFDDLEIVILRAPGVYGPVRPGVGSQSSQLIQTLLLQALNGQPVAIEAGPGWAEEYLYGKDLGRAIARAALDAGRRDRVVWNVGTGVRTTAAGLCRALHQAVPGSRIRWGGDEAASKEQPLDVSRISQALGFVTEFDLVGGLSDHVHELLTA